MSAHIDTVAPDRPLFGSRATSSNQGLHLSLVALLLLMATELSFAAPLGAELLLTGIASRSLPQEADAPVDEIVVIGIRNEDCSVRPWRLLNEPLLQHILHDFEMRREFEREFEGRLESADAGEATPAVRTGHDLLEEDCEPSCERALKLPVELIRPAIVISVDF